MSFFIIECSCGMSVSMPKAALRNHPGGEITCENMTKDRQICGRIYRNADMIKILDRGQNVYRAPGVEQLEFK